MRRLVGFCTLNCKYASKIALHHLIELGSPIRIRTHADQHFSHLPSQQRNSLRFDVAGDVIRMPAENYIDFGMLL